MNLIPQIRQTARELASIEPAARGVILLRRRLELLTIIECAARNARENLALSHDRAHQAAGMSDLVAPNPFIAGRIGANGAGFGAKQAQAMMNAQPHSPKQIAEAQAQQRFAMAMGELGTVVNKGRDIIVIEEALRVAVGEAKLPPDDGDESKVELP